MESLGAALGIDLGGTAIKAGIVDGKGNILVAGVVPTLPDTGWENVVGRIVRLARELMDEAGMPVVRRVGIGIPGVVEPEEGRVVMAPNLGWKDVPVGKRLSEDFGCPVYMDNDAHLAALGEYWVGAGQGARSLFLVTVGTGIGSAVIIDGRLHRGATGRGAEFGHWKVADEPPCSCGNSGCLEMLASGRAMVRQVQEAISKGQKTSLSGLASISAKQIIDEARRGDELASRVLAQATRYLGRALGNIIVVLEPQKILIGGGVAEAGEIFFRPVREEIERTSFPYFNQTEVSCTALGNRAGIIGAAGLALGKVG